MKFFAKNPKEPDSKTKYELELCIYDLKNEDHRKIGFTSLREEQLKGWKIFSEISIQKV